MARGCRGCGGGYRNKSVNSTKSSVNGKKSSFKNNAKGSTSKIIQMDTGINEGPRYIRIVGDETIYQVR